ncbi:MAG: hypothetical protein H0T79_18080, partial [Deltaproteobacteria bacterium]|nr:hypothetical protein [Deltaproteobacteria bacterium]
MNGWRRIVQVGSILAAIGVGAVLGLLDPTSLQGGAGWSVVVLAVLWGYGAALERLLRIRIGLGEQLVLGTAVFVLLGGWLLAFGVASTVPLFVVAGGGVALALVELVRRARLPVANASPISGDRRLALWLLGGALVAYLTITLLGEVAGRGNPFDDHVAYTAFVKRMLDCGDLIEPFSFRRVSAYGGQTVLLALAALRGDVESTGLLDRGVFAWVVALVVLDLARKRRLHLGVIAMVMIFLFTLRDLSSNSASAWTGLACFLAAYGFATNPDLTPRTSLLLVFATCATACTLRQNYLVPAGLFAALMLVAHVRARRTST